MDQIRIGSYIAQCRRKKKWTQKELAEKLGVTDKSVSKWENGYCLPDPALYQPLCDALEITPNDLFGEDLERKNERAVDKKLLEMLINSIYKSCSDRISPEECEKAYDFYMRLGNTDSL